MIRPLRQLHRRVFVTLAMILPTALAIGIATRRAVPLTAAVPPALQTTPQPFAAVVWSRADLFSKSPVLVRLLREGKDSGPFAFSFTAPINFVRPDLMVYWATGVPNPADTLPTNAVLLGAFNLPALPLQESVVHSRGTLMLYSLATGEIVDVSKPMALNGSTQPP